MIQQSQQSQPLQSVQQDQGEQSEGSSASAFETQVVQIENANPSGFYCELDGLFKDTIYCNLFHVCMGGERKTYQCKLFNNDTLIAIYDPSKMACVIKQQQQDVYSICKGILYESNFPNVASYQDNSESVTTTSETTAKLNEKQTQSNTQQQTQPLVGSYMAQLVSGLIDPAPGYIQLSSSQFQTSFKCPQDQPGYYPNDGYCDIFHYCYANGQFKTYTCASMQNQYQLWWSHQAEPGRRDVIYIILGLKTLILILN